MNAKSWIMVKTLLNKYHKGTTDAVVAFLPEESLQTLLSQDTRSDDPSAALENYVSKINKIHYSWLIDPLQQLVKPLQTYCAASLNESQQKGISKTLSISLPSQPLHPLFQDYFARILYSKVCLPEMIPTSYLTPTSLTPLANLTKTQIVEVIDLLGLHDLVSELRHIVDKRLLKKVYACLSKKKQIFLKTILHQKDHFVIPRLELEHWNGSCEKLEKVLHRRGIIRLGKALSGQHPDFIWAIAHLLDVGRGAILEKQYSKEAVTGVTPSLVAEVVNAMSFVKQNVPPNESM